MGQAFLSLYASTADHTWLKRAEDAADFIAAHFMNSNPGIVTSAAPSPIPRTAGFSPQFTPQLDENISAARFANLLFHYDGIARHQDLALRAMKFLAAPTSTATRGWVIGGVLLADAEINSDPLHITIVGAKSDPLADQLFRTARTSPTFYKRTEWFDPAEGSLPNADVEYPQLSTAAAFLCSNGACSSPITDSAILAHQVRR